MTAADARMLPGRQPAEKTPGRWSEAARRGLPIWAITTAAYLCLGSIVQAFGLDHHRYRHSPSVSRPFRMYARGDAGHFLSIARDGYYGPHSDPLSAAFFPGYPLAGRTLARMFSVGPPSVTTYLVALCLVSWAGTAAAAVLLWRLAADQAGARVATAAVVVLLAGPYSVFLVSSYSEGPFLALALGAWVAAKGDRWVLASLCAALAAVTRVSGVFLACALIVLYLQSRTTERRPWPALEAVALTAPFLAVFGYFAWLHYETASWLTWFHVQRVGWNRHTVTPVKAFTASVHRALSITDPDAWELRALRFQGTMELLFALAFVGAVVVLVRRHRWPEATYVGLTAAALLTSAYYLSVPRNMVTCFPVAILVGEWLVRRRGRPTVYILATCSVLVALIDVVSILTDHWSG